MARISLLTPIDETTLDSTNVAASGLSEYDYSGSTTYSSGDQVKVSYESDGSTPRRPIKEFEATGSTSNYPPSNPDVWSDLGPSNRWAMFDDKGVTQTENSSTIEVEIDASDMTFLALFQLSGNEVTVTHYDESTSPRTEIWSETIDLLDRNTTSWSEYFFGEFTYKRQYAKYFTAYSNSTLAITITAGTTTKCGQCVVGEWYDIGGLQWEAEVKIQDFSKRIEDDFGQVTLSQGEYVKSLSGRLNMPKSSYNAVYRSFTQIRAVTVVLDGNGNDTDYEALRFFGYVRKFKPSLTNPSQNQYRIEARGQI